IDAEAVWRAMPRRRVSPLAHRREQELVLQTVRELNVFGAVDGTISVNQGEARWRRDPLDARRHLARPMGSGETQLCSLEAQITRTQRPEYFVPLAVEGQQAIAAGSRNRKHDGFPVHVDPRGRAQTVRVRMAGALIERAGKVSCMRELIDGGV